MNMPLSERITGAVMGALVGDALGLGPHWYYNLDELRLDYGEWIHDYAPPKPQRFHANCQAGDVSQTGQVLEMLLASTAEKGGYDEKDFTARLDGLLHGLDGTPSGGRYTDEAMRDVWRARKDGVSWDKAGSLAVTAEAAIRLPVLAGRYAKDLPQAFSAMADNVRLTHQDPQVAGTSLAFGLLVWALLNGVDLAKAPEFLKEQAGKKGLEFFYPYYCGSKTGLKAKFFDSLLLPGWMTQVATDPAFRIEPASAICRVYGLACQIWMLLPAAFYLAGRFTGNFETAVLSAINGGGNNMARASLTGALCGAMGGLGAIPERFITGLVGHERHLAQARALAQQAGE